MEGCTNAEYSIEYNRTGIVYKEASSKSKAVAKITKKDKIEYQSDFKKVKKKIWLKVYLPERKIEGWLKGEAVEKTQMKELLGR